LQFDDDEIAPEPARVLDEMWQGRRVLYFNADVKHWGKMLSTYMRRKKIGAIRIGKFPT